MAKQSLIKNFLFIFLSSGLLLLGSHASVGNPLDNKLANDSPDGIRRTIQSAAMQNFCEENYAFNIYSHNLRPGTILYTEVHWKKASKLPVPDQIEIIWEKLTIKINRHKTRPNIFLGIFGISVHSQTGPQPIKLKVSWFKKRGNAENKTNQPSIEKNIMFNHSLEIESARFETLPEKLRVAKKFTSTVVRQKTETKEEKILRDKFPEDSIAEKKALSLDTSRQWNGTFLDPRNFSPVTSSFYQRRMYNTNPGAPHSGVDLKGRFGRPIRAMNHGKVALAREMFFHGKIIIIDHGNGLQTLYKHLSEISIKEGDQIKKGNLIGYVGSSGLSTGPHLHLSFYFYGRILDPLTIIGLPILED